MRNWNANNPEKVKTNTARKYAKSKAKDIARSRAWREKNPEKVKAYWNNFHARNSHLEKEWNRKKRINGKDRFRKTAKRYHEERPGLKALWDANRRASKKRATPSWANKFFIAEAYSLAKLREKLCGGSWHVDHIVPLQSKYVCGLHVEHNLQVILGHINQAKSNVTWPDMP